MPAWLTVGMMTGQLKKKTAPKTPAIHLYKAQAQKAMLRLNQFNKFSLETAKRNGRSNKHTKYFYQWHKNFEHDNENETITTTAIPPQKNIYIKNSVKNALQKQYLGNIFIFAYQND